GAVGRQFALHLGQLFAHARGVAPLGVDEGAGVDDQALVEVAALGAPRLLQHLVAFPVLPRVEQTDKLQEWGRPRAALPMVAHGIPPAKGGGSPKEAALPEGLLLPEGLRSHRDSSHSGGFFYGPLDTYRERRRGSAEKGDDVAGQKPQDGTDDDDDGTPLDGGGAGAFAPGGRLLGRAHLLTPVNP